MALIPLSMNHVYVQATRMVPKPVETGDDQLSAFREHYSDINSPLASRVSHTRFAAQSRWQSARLRQMMQFIEGNQQRCLLQFRYPAVVMLRRSALCGFECCIALTVVAASSTEALFSWVMRLTQAYPL